MSGALCTASSSLSRRLLSSAMPTPCSYWPSRKHLQDPLVCHVRLMPCSYWPSQKQAQEPMLCHIGLGFLCLAWANTRALMVKLMRR